MDVGWRPFQKWGVSRAAIYPRVWKKKCKVDASTVQIFEICTALAGAKFACAYAQPAWHVHRGKEWCAYVLVHMASLCAYVANGFSTLRRHRYLLLSICTAVGTPADGLGKCGYPNKFAHTIDDWSIFFHMHSRLNLPDGDALNVKRMRIRRKLAKKFAC